MRNSLRILKRDLSRIARTRKTWVIVLGVLVTPALYAWFNINAFWDPYANTRAITVAVANLDEGASSDLTGDINIGDEVEGQLRDNDQLGWTFSSETDAHAAVAKGSAYAAIIIPQDFSANLLTITTGDFTQPSLTYLVNEKASAIAPKITDVGASTIDKQITDAFVAQVSEAATDAIKDAGADTEQRLTTAKNRAVASFDDAIAKIASARTDVSGMTATVENSRTKLAAARDTLAHVDGTLNDVQGAIGQVQSLVSEAQSVVVNFTDAATSAYVDGSALLADATAKAGTTATRLSGALDDASVRVDSAIDGVNHVVEANGVALERLQTIIDDNATDPDLAQRLSETVTTLQERNTTDHELLTNLTTLNQDIAGAAQKVSDVSSALTTATAAANDAAVGTRTALTDSVPALNSAMSTLSSSAGQLSAAIDAQRTQMSQASSLLSGLDAQLVSTSGALSAFTGNLAGIETDLKTARTDIAALGAATLWQKLDSLGTLDPHQIASFVSSPVEVVQHTLFPVKNYGSAMAALFTNLSLWIGAFVLMVIFKVEVDTEGVEDVTVGEAYMGRFWLLAGLSAGQGLIVSIGNLVIGIQTANAVAYVVTSVAIGLAYLSIIYALSVAFGHVGRGLAILLVIMQIPGASGLYPIEMMPAFFRGIYPYLPFTYGIDALRETIASFYGAHYWRYMGVLALFVIAAFVVGLVFRRRLANLGWLFNREIARTGLLIGENVQVTGGGYRLADVYRALTDRSAFRAEAERSSRTFLRRYPALVRGVMIAAAVGLVVLGMLAWALPTMKANLLAVWVLWCLLSIAALVSIDYVRYSHARSLAMAGLDDNQLRSVAVEGTRSSHAILSAAGESAQMPDLPQPATATGALPVANEDDDVLTRLFDLVDESDGAGPAPDPTGVREPSGAKEETDRRQHNHHENDSEEGQR